MRLCMVTFGISSVLNGYTQRTRSVLNEISKYFEHIDVIEFTRFNETKSLTEPKNASFIKIYHIKNYPEWISNLFKHVLTFDPLRNFISQVCMLLGLIKNRNYMRSADIVMIEGCLFPMANIIARLMKKKIVLDTHCINKLLAQDFKKRNMLVYLLRSFFWGMLEKFTMHNSDIIICVSEKEKEFVVREYKLPQSKVFFVPNIIELKSIPSTMDLSLVKKYGLENKTVVTFVGDLSSVQNADAADYIIQELAPIFLKKHKDVVFLVVGSGADKFKCALPNVVFTGYVDDLASVLMLSDVCIAPLRVGAGTKTKVIEYLAFEKPVVSTPSGIEGLESYIGDDSVSVCNIEHFAEVLSSAVLNKNKKSRANNIKELNEIFKKNIAGMVGALR